MGKKARAKSQNAETAGPTSSSFPATFRERRQTALEDTDIELDFGIPAATWDPRVP